MSYCRWSSDNWRCAVYCYESDRGYETHVAANKAVGEIPPEPPFSEIDRPDWLARHKAVLAWLRDAERQPIGLSRDGESYLDPDLPSFLARLESLKAEGYNVPQFVIDDVRQELSDASGERGTP